jgi:hypothetical protein
MGASMYLRRSVCRNIGPYDVHAGTSAQFNIEDRDYAYRVLAAGHPVLLTPLIRVHGTIAIVARAYCCEAMASASGRRT